MIVYIYEVIIAILVILSLNLVFKLLDKYYEVIKKINSKHKVQKFINTIVFLNLILISFPFYVKYRETNIILSGILLGIGWGLFGLVKKIQINK
jgi:Na+/H+ antiporter NhaC